MKIACVSGLDTYTAKQQITAQSAARRTNTVPGNTSTVALYTRLYTGVASSGMSALTTDTMPNTVPNSSPSTNLEIFPLAADVTISMNIEVPEAVIR